MFLTVKHLVAERVFQKNSLENIFGIGFVFQMQQAKPPDSVGMPPDGLADFLFTSHGEPGSELALMVPSAMPPDHREVLEAVLALPQKYRTVIYLHYYEEYSAPQIGQMLHKNVNTIYTLLSRGRNLLREKLGGDEHEGSAESRL